MSYDALDHMLRYLHVTVYVSCLTSYKPFESYITCHTGVCGENEHSSGEKHTWEDKLSECQIRGWRAVSAAGLHGKGSPQRNVFSQTLVASFALMGFTRSGSHYYTVKSFNIYTGNCPITTISQLNEHIQATKHFSVSRLSQAQIMQATGLEV